MNQLKTITGPCFLLIHFFLTASYSMPRPYSLEIAAPSVIEGTTGDQIQIEAVVQLTRAEISTSTPIPSATSTAAPTPSPSDTTDFDIAPETPDGIVNTLDLIKWLALRDQGVFSSDVVFDFSQFWDRTGRSTALTADYEVTFEAVWSQSTHPTDFPSGAHFSGLIGGTHNSNVTFWQAGGLASPGIESMAETGRKTLLNQEINAVIQAGNAEFVISGGGINSSPDSVSESFSITREFPLVTLVSMIAPSPDWFVGVSGLSLFDNGNWVETIVVPLQPYDAGSDSGTNYTSPNENTVPHELIFEITGAPFQVGDSVPPLGTFTFQRTD